MEAFVAHTHFDSTGIPFCVEPRDCTNLVIQPGVAKSEASERFLYARLYCLKNFEVPDFLADNLTSTQVVKINSGSLVFADSVCGCDAAWGISGPDCELETDGILILTLLTSIAAWILFQLIGLSMLYKTGKFKAKRKKCLALCAIGQYIGHLLWIFGQRGFFALIPNIVILNVIWVIGYFIATFATYTFLCLMVLETIDLVQKGARGKLSKTSQRLIGMKKVFHVMPFVVSVATAVLFGVYTPTSLFLLTACQSTCLAIVAVAFGIMTSVLTRRLNMLIIPYETQARATGGVLNITHDNTSHDVERLSRKLRTVARRMRNITATTGLASFAFVVVSNQADARLGILPNVVGGFFHLAQTSIPTVGISGIRSLARKIGVLQSAKQSRIYGGAKPSELFVESSDVGTLGE